MRNEKRETAKRRKTARLKSRVSVMKRGWRLYDALSSLNVVDDPIVHDSSSTRLARTMRRDLVAKEISKVRSAAATSIVRNRSESFQQSVEDRLMKIRRDVVKCRLLKQKAKTERVEKPLSRNMIERKKKDTENRYFPEDNQFDTLKAAEEELLHILFPKRMWNMVCKIDEERKKKKNVDVRSESRDSSNSAKSIESSTSKPIDSNSAEPITPPKHNLLERENIDKVSSENNDPLSALRRLERTLSTFESSPSNRQDDSPPETLITNESALSTKVHPDMSLLEMSVIDCDDDESSIHSSSQVQPYPRDVPPPQPSPHPARAKIPAWLRRKYLTQSGLPQKQQTNPYYQKRPKVKRRARLPRKKEGMMSSPHRRRGNVSEYIRAGEAAGTAGGMNWLASLRGR